MPNGRGLPRLRSPRPRSAPGPGPGRLAAGPGDGPRARSLPAKPFRLPANRKS